MVDVRRDDHALEISKRLDGRTQIVFRKSILKGKVTSGDVLNAIFIAARMQAEKYIEKLSRGATLDTQEVRALKDLADITKLELITPQQQLEPIDTQEVSNVKQELYKALTDRFK